MADLKPQGRGGGARLHAHPPEKPQVPGACATGCLASTHRAPPRTAGRTAWGTALAGRGPGAQAYLAPHQHGSEHDLQAVKEVVSDYDHGGSPRGPAFTGADGLDARSGCSHKTENAPLSAPGPAPTTPPAKGRAGAAGREQARCSGQHAKGNRTSAC